MPPPPLPPPPPRPWMIDALRWRQCRINVQFVVDSWELSIIILTTTRAYSQNFYFIVQIVMNIISSNFVAQMLHLNVTTQNVLFRFMYHDKIFMREVYPQCAFLSWGSICFALTGINLPIRHASLMQGSYMRTRLIK